MFGAQMPRGGQGLVYAGMDQRVVQALSEILGQCQSNYQHRGSVELFGPLTASGDTKFKGQADFVGDVAIGGPNGRGGPLEVNSPSTFNGPVTFNDDVSFASEVLRRWFPQYVELTTAMTTSATAKFKYWNGSSYADTPDATFTLYDPQKLARASLSGQQGWAIYDRDREAWVVLSMNPPLTRRGTIGSVLTRDGSATFTDASDSSTVTVYGQLVKSGYRIPTSARVLATWCQGENSGAGRWLATAIDDCLEVVP
jgi:hypothetical protein